MSHTIFHKQNDSQSESTNFNPFTHKLETF